MPTLDPTETRVLAALQSLGSAGLSQLASEIDDLSPLEIEAGLSRLETARLVVREVPGGSFYRIVRTRVDWTGMAGRVTIVHNDPAEMILDANEACQIHASLQHANLETAFAALLEGAQLELQIVSPFIDVRSVERFAHEFEEAFSRGVRFTLVSRGILRPEDFARRDQRAAKLDAIRMLWQLYSRHNGEEQTRFSICDYLKIGRPPESQPRNRGPLEATVHHKIIVADRRWAYIGSGEFRNTSFGPTGEVGVLVDGAHASLLGDLVQCYARRALPVDPMSLESTEPDDEPDDDPDPQGSSVLGVRGGG